jgi:hypothetical protein
MLWLITSHTFGYVLLLILAIPAVVILIFLVSPLLFPLVMMGVGALWSAEISVRVVEQQERGIYDLLCVLPGGRWAASWAIACGRIHQGDTFDFGWLMLRSIVMVGVIMLLTLFGMALGWQLFSAEVELNNVGWFMLDMAVLLIGQLLHHIQTMALSPLVGLLVPTYVHSRAEARIGAAGLFLSLQLGPYLFCGSLLNFMPVLTGEPVDAANSLAPYVLILLGLREAVIMRLWIILLRRLKLTAVEKEHLWTLLQQGS